MIEPKPISAILRNQSHRTYSLCWQTECIFSDFFQRMKTYYTERNKVLKQVSAHGWPLLLTEWNKSTYASMDKRDGNAINFGNSVNLLWFNFLKIKMINILYYISRISRTVLKYQNICRQDCCKSMFMTKKTIKNWNRRYKMTF